MNFLINILTTTKAIAHDDYESYAWTTTVLKIISAVYMLAFNLTWQLDDEYEFISLNPHSSKWRDVPYVINIIVLHLYMYFI